MTPVPPRDAERLRHVIDACDRIDDYVGGSRAALDDPRTSDAVLYCLTIVGEALGALSDATYARLPSVPTAAPKAQRNLIVHEYWRVDRDVIWDTVSHALPRLRADASAVLGDV
ncbi:HepT-like ribonuclease domain-containing protein [Demequina silvatica]|uniref:HepT-like ribonuclease domain-containing protein n=1 Tax=Demequina silvatica TaxID=1638988 RepID=UPI000782BD8B|nr:HepT-like ribonuclease domain-containing protein [Demequina silvatica]